MEPQRNLVQMLGSLALFSDLSHPELEAAAHTFSEEWFAKDQRILRQGFTGSGFHIIAEGEAVVRIDGKDVARLGRGDFFGEISILTEGPPTTDIVAEGVLHCLVIPRPDVERFLLDRPRVMLRMLRAEANRLRGMLEWQS